MSLDGQSMGGHFSALLDSRKNLLPGNFLYESARSALYSLLKVAGPRCLHVPNYVCEAVLQAAAAADVEVKRYPLGSGFEIASELDVAPDELVLVVNYFGVCADAVERVGRKIPPQRIILDCSQAYFYSGRRYFSEIYSPRKFLPAADGGVLRCDVSPDCEPSESSQASIERYQYLLQRVVGEPELSRELYLQAEHDLEAVSSRGMSIFTRRILETTDIDFIRLRRRENFSILEGLKNVNLLSLDLGNQVPLCYPFMFKEGAKVRNKLLDMRIFTPKYWPGVVPMSDFEYSLLNEAVFLPIDHRYDAKRMGELLSLVMDLI